MRLRLATIPLVVLAFVMLGRSVQAAPVSIDPPTTPVAVTTAKVRLAVTLDKTSVIPPATVRLTFVVTNTGTSTATHVAIDNLLPVEFSYVNGIPAALKNLGDLRPGQTITKSYVISIPASVKTNRYVDEAIVSADNADRVESTAALDVNNGQVLGATDATVGKLATTGGSPVVMILLGLLLAIFGAEILRTRSTD